MNESKDQIGSCKSYTLACRRCGSPGCSACSPGWSYRSRERLVRNLGLMGVESVGMATFTIDASRYGVGLNAYHHLTGTRVVGEFMRYAATTYGLPGAYVCFKEFTRSGQVHLHVLLPAWGMLDRHVLDGLREWGIEHCGRWHYEFGAPGKGAWYVTKYASKGTWVPDWLRALRGFKFCTSSRGFWVDGVRDDYAVGDSVGDDGECDGVERIADVSGKGRRTARTLGERIDGCCAETVILERVQGERGGQYFREVGYWCKSLAELQAVGGDLFKLRYWERDDAWGVSYSSVDIGAEDLDRLKRRMVCAGSADACGGIPAGVRQLILVQCDSSVELVLRGMPDLDVMPPADLPRESIA